MPHRHGRFTRPGFDLEALRAEVCTPQPTPSAPRRPVPRPPSGSGLPYVARDIIGTEDLVLELQARFPSAQIIQNGGRIAVAYMPRRSQTPSPESHRRIDTIVSALSHSGAARLTVVAGMAYTGEQSKNGYCVSVPLEGQSETLRDEAFHVSYLLNSHYDVFGAQNQVSARVIESRDIDEATAAADVVRRHIMAGEVLQLTQPLKAVLHVTPP